MTFKVQFLDKVAYLWIDMMSYIRSEREAITIAEHRAKNTDKKIRVICNRGSVVYMCN